MNRFVAPLLVLLALAIAPSAFGLNPAAPFRDYAIDRWTVDSGLPQLSVLSVVQDRDGFLWIGTQGGITRFDGVSFDVFDRARSGGVDTSDASTSLVDRRGRIWFGTQHGAVLHESGRFRLVSSVVGPISINGLAEDADGEPLFATSGGLMVYADGVLRARGDDTQPAFAVLRRGAEVWTGETGALVREIDGVQNPIALPRAFANARVTRHADEHGVLWIGTTQGLLRLAGDSIEIVALVGSAGDEAGQSKLERPSVESLLLDHDGNLWIGTTSSLFRRRPDSNIERVRDEDFVRNAYVVSLYEDREGNLWIGSRTESLFRLWSGWATRYGTREGLTDPLIWSVARDPRGYVVLGSNSNVMTLEHGVLRELIPGAALPNPSAYELSYDAEGRLWVGTRSGIAVFDDGKDVTPPALRALAPHQVNAIVPQPRGAAWIGTQAGLFRFRAGALDRIGLGDGTPAARVRAIHVVAPDELLLGTEAGVRRLRGGVIDTPEWSAPLEGVFVSSIAEIKPGLLGVTTRDAGIGLVSKDRLLMLDTDDGLPTTNGWSMQVLDGQLYVTSIDGVYRVPVATLPDPARGITTRLTTEIVLGRLSGNQHMHCCNGGARSRILRDDDGIWLPAIQGAIHLDTRSIAPPPLPPAVIIKSLKHAGDTYAPGAGIRIGPGRRDVEIQFTGISFRGPANLRFRYKLEGYDQDWIDAGDRRRAFYTNLPPGQFTFLVQSRLSDSIVSPTDASLAFELEPHWHERADVRAAIAGLLILVAIGVQLRLRHRYRRRGLVLERLVAERTAELSDSNFREHEANLELRRQIEERIAAQQTLQERHEELVALNQRLEDAQSALLQSEKMASVGQLAAGVAHEINNPIGFVQSNLRSMEGYVTDLCALLETYERVLALLPADHAEVATLKDLRERIEIGYLRDDIGDLLRESLDGVTRVVKIVRDLKEFSHVDSSEWQQVDIHEGIESTLNVVAHELKYKAQVVKLYGDVPAIECLPFQINQVLLNLFVNAAQAMGKIGTITIRTWCERDEACVEIADTGRGIEPAHLKRIFEPFFTTKPVGQGTGLGLSVSYGIVKKHGGRIEVASTVGTGTTFTVRLPVHGRGEGTEPRAGAPVSASERWAA